jgi:hypothetical protein
MALCGVAICVLICFVICGHKTSRKSANKYYLSFQIRHIMLYSNLYIIKVVLGQICAVFAELRSNYENVRICNLWIGTPKKLADLR